MFDLGLVIFSFIILPRIDYDFVSDAFCNVSFIFSQLKKAFLLCKHIKTYAGTGLRGVIFLEPQGVFSLALFSQLGGSGSAGVYELWGMI